MWCGGFGPGDERAETAAGRQTVFGGENVVQNVKGEGVFDAHCK